MPGVWAWNPPALVAGPAGSALRTLGLVYETAAPLSLPPEDELTVAFWARSVEVTGTTRWPILQADAQGEREWGVYFHPMTGQFVFSTSFRKEPEVHVEFHSGFSAGSGEWHHYAATYSKHIKQVALYVDGVVRTTAFQDGGSLRGGRGFVRLGLGGPMDLDEVLVYSRALGPADIAALARKSAPPRDGLVAAWNFDDSRQPLRASAPAGSPILQVMEPDGIRWAREARRQGIRPIVILGFPPDWAAQSVSDDVPVEGATPPDLTMWREYVRNVTRHYRQLVDTWEVWHEPNDPAYWAPASDAHRYLQLLKTAYEAARQGNPDCRILMPALAGPDENGRGLAYLFRLLELGGARYCDGISIHPYRTAPPESSRFADQIREIYQRAAASGHPRRIWLTEYSWPTDLSSGVSERAQASLLARSAILALATGKVEALLWYRLHDSGPDRTLPTDNCGLCDERLRPKPAFFAHRTLAVLLGGATPVSSGKLTRDVYVTTFRSGSERLAAVWATEGRHVLALRAGRPKVQITDLMGNSKLVPTEEGVLMLSVGELPVFVRYLRPAAGWLDPPISATKWTPADEGAVKCVLRIANPYPTARRVSVRLSGATIGDGRSAELLLAGGAAHEVPVYAAVGGTGSSDTVIRVRVAFSAAGKATQPPTSAEAEFPMPAGLFSGLTASAPPK